MSLILPIAYILQNVPMMLVCTTHLQKMQNLYITYENPAAQVSVLSGFSPFLEITTMITLRQTALVRKKQM